MATMANLDRMFPIGIQNFPEIIVEGYTYVDKTYFVGKLIKGGKYNFLSRPRRFGKSLLLSTIQTYFEGRRDLFKGLAIDDMNLDWTPRPIFYFDFNTGNYGHPDGLKNRLISLLSLYEKEYDVEVSMEKDTALRFENLIRQVYKKTGQQVVILVDEYDKPLLNLD